MATVKVILTVELETESTTDANQVEQQMQHDLNKSLQSGVPAYQGVRTGNIKLVQVNRNE